MKKSCFKACYALLLTLLVSCSKEPKWAGYFNECYAGAYRLESATLAPTLVSNLIDFDGSGRKTNDIIDGLGMTSQDLSQADLVISNRNNVPLDGEIECLTLYVPAQRTVLNGSKLEMMSSPNYVLCPVKFYYSVDDEGRMRFFEDGDLSGLISLHEWMGGSERNPQLLNSSKAKMVKCENGEIVISVGLCYVDWTDGSYINIESYFTYKRQ